MKKLTVSIGLLALFGSGAIAQDYSAWWFDGFDTTGATSNINADLGFPRQGGSAAPTTYSANTPDPSNDYHHQMFGTAPLQLAGDGGLSKVLVSPDYNFVGVGGLGYVGKRIAVVMDAFTSNAGGTYFSQSAITVGGAAGLTQAGSGGTGFSVVFVEQTFNALAPSNFIQIFDGGTLLLNDYVNPVGAGSAFVEIFIDDLSDGNPWDGIGSTTIAVSVATTPIGQWTIGGGGYTSNHITLEGSAQFVGTQLATHVFDNLEVNSGLATPILVPEPSTYAILLGGLALGFVMIRRRMKQ